MIWDVIVIGAGRQDWDWLLVHRAGMKFLLLDRGWRQVKHGRRDMIEVVYAEDS